LPLFAAALLALVVALFALAAQLGLFIRGRDGVKAGADHRAGGLGRPADDGRSASDDSADQAALEHQTAPQDDDDLRYGNEAISTTHEGRLQRFGIVADNDE
jgi:hypothetical protein